MLEPTQGSPKRPRQEEEEEIGHIQADPIPPSPINIPSAPPSSPITPFPPASTPQTPPSPLPHDIPKSSSAPTSPQQQHFSDESSDIPTSLTEETAQPMDKTKEEEKQTNGKQQQSTKVDVPILIIQEEETTNEQAIQEMKSFDYTKLIQTLSRQFQCQQVVAKETELQKDRANKAQEEITKLRLALELVAKERESSARENENLLTLAVVTPKKTGKWRVCVDYRPLNEATKRDHFSLPFQDEILNEVAGKEKYTICDGYSGYFQIGIALEDQLKTTFITPWGCFAFRVMPFGLTNAPATFQRFMNMVFQEFFGKSIRVFIDDFCIYSSTPTSVT
ncbi:hypothetical protein L7F22_012349 [Adiantum nelumboides]|nr:hypothetical protein [Adiantum nelumboides]